MKGRLLCAAAAVAAATIGLSGCGTHRADGDGKAAAPPDRSSSAPASASASTPAGSTKPVTVTIGAGLTGSKPVHLQVGQQLRLAVSPSVQVGFGSTTGATPCAQPHSAAAPVLKRLCVADTDDTYQALRPGSTTLSFSIHPKCAAGSVCPNWVRVVRLPVTVAKA